MTPYVSTVDSGRDGFGQLLRAEWTKFRTVPGWVAGTVVAVALMLLFAFLTAAGNHTEHVGGSSGAGSGDGSSVDDGSTHATSSLGAHEAPVGPDGETVDDGLFFVHQTLSGDGTVTARVTSLTTTVESGDSGGGAPQAAEGFSVPWVKAGLIVKQNTTQGSAYAAVMATGAHGVRMQDNYTGDIAGPRADPLSYPLWLRLTRTGTTVTGYTSADGNTWASAGTVHVGQLTSTVQIGLFVASPGAHRFQQRIGGASTEGLPSTGTATFDSVSVQGSLPDGAWKGVNIGASPEGTIGFQQSDGTFTVTGSGDIAPGTGDIGQSVTRYLEGAFAALTVIVVLGVLFVSTEYRRGLIRTSLTASPRRGRVLAAKAIVLGTVAFLTGLVSATGSLLLGHALGVGSNNFHSPFPTEVRIVVGTAALLAACAVLAVAVGAILRRSAGAVAAVVVLTVLPYILAVAAVLPAVPAQWVLRLTPAAGFAVQQTVVAYSQVDGSYTPAFGYFPLPPWGGLAVLCGWAALALAVATYLLRRRDV
jgi:ABC-type transport system involved in multi-copper enzyme maturation permease subunit